MSSSEETDRSVQALLSEFMDALGAEEFEAAGELLPELQNQIQENQATEETVISQSKSVRDSEDLAGEQARLIFNLINQVQAVNLRRAQFFSTASAFLSNPIERDVSSLTEAIEELQEAESQTQELINQTSSALEEFEIPPSVVIRIADLPPDGVSVGESTPLQVEIDNVGSSAITNGEIVVSAADSISIEEDTFSVESIDAGETVTEETTIVANQGGSFTLTVRFAMADMNIGSQSQIFFVTEEDGITGTTSNKDIYDLARDTLKNLSNKVSNNDAINKKKKKKLTRILGSAISSLDHAVSNVECDEADEADEAVNAAITQIEEFLTRFEKISGPSASFIQVITENAENVIDQLSGTLK